jgi:hypothetical protein
MNYKGVIMGTNYYLQRRDPKTGRCKDLHICKCSYGWTPSMRGYKKRDFNNELNQGESIESWKDWKWFLRKETSPAIGSLIFDEYDEPVEVFEFFSMIEKRQTEDGYGNNIEHPKKNHAEEAAKGEFSNGVTDEHSKSCWIDSEGYSFHDGEFS